MSNAKNLNLGPLHYHISKVALKKLLEQGLLTEEELERADNYLYDKYKPYMSPDKPEGNNIADPAAAKSAPFSVSDDYISLTDIARQYDSEKPSYIIQSWLRNRSTLGFMDLWEKKHNPDYSTQGYETLLTKSSKSSFTITLKQWTEQTKAMGIKSKQGKSGGTYAHPTIACEFLTWLSPGYKLDFLEMRQFVKENR